MYCSCHNRCTQASGSMAKMQTMLANQQGTKLSPSDSFIHPSEFQQFDDPKLTQSTGIQPQWKATAVLFVPYSILATTKIFKWKALALAYTWKRQNDLMHRKKFNYIFCINGFHAGSWQFILGFLTNFHICVCYIFCMRFQLNLHNLTINLIHK